MSLTASAPTGTHHPDLLASIFIGRLPADERDAASTALTAWLAFRNASHKVLTRSLALDFKRSLGADPSAETAYATVSDFHEWLVATGINSANPFTPPARRR